MVNKEQNRGELKYEGWKRMKAILDKEMPVKKKRRLAPFIITAILVVMITGLAYLTYTNQYSGGKSQVFPSNTKDAKDSRPVPATKHIENNSHKTFNSPRQYLKKQGKPAVTPHRKPASGNRLNKASFPHSVPPAVRHVENKNKPLATTTPAKKLQKPIKAVKGTPKYDLLPPIEKSGTTLLAYNGELEMLPLPEYSGDNVRPIWDWFNPYLSINFHNISLDDWNTRLELFAGNRIKISNKYFVDLGVNFTRADNIYNAVIIKINTLDFDEESASAYINNRDNSTKDYRDLSYRHYNGFRNIIKKTIFGLHMNQVFAFEKKINLVFGSQFYYTQKINRVIDTNTDSYAPERLNNGNLTVPEYTFAFSFSLYYNLNTGVGINMGYKHYFTSEHPTLSTSLEKLESNAVVNKQVYISQRSKISNLFLGIKYVFD